MRWLKMPETNVQVIALGGGLNMTRHGCHGGGDVPYGVC